MSHSPVQIIDDDGNFLLKRTDLSCDDQLYHIVSILGCQSSGKSTLLNSLFGTKFAELDSSQGRLQTTKGLWLSMDHATSSFIIDVEGNDSAERQDDGEKLERQAALFSLAVADVVIINLWYNDIGRRAGSSTPLLKVVFEANLKIFGTESKTSLLIVVRDWTPTLTPMDRLKQQLLSLLAKIWADIEKPADCEIEDSFNISIFGIPSKIFAAEDYMAKIRDLRSSFFESNSLKPRTIVDADFPLYASQIWETIISSSELNIFSQKELLARCRCEEIVQNELIWFIKEIQPSHIEKTFDTEIFTQLIRTSLERYHQKANAYPPTVYTEYKKRMTERMFQELETPCAVYLENVREHIKPRPQQLRGPWTFVAKERVILVDGVSFPDFCSRIGADILSWRESVRSQYIKDCQKTKISLTTDFADEEICHDFKDQWAEEILDRSIDVETARLERLFEAQLRVVMKQRVESCLGSLKEVCCTPLLEKSRLWHAISRICKLEIDNLNYAIQPGVLKSCSEKTNDIKRDQSARDKLAIEVAQMFKGFFTQNSKTIVELVSARFDRFHDLNSPQRGWTQAIELLSILSVVCLKADIILEEPSLLSDRGPFECEALDKEKLEEIQEEVERAANWTIRVANWKSIAVNLVAPALSIAGMAWFGFKGTPFKK